jgi:hypothetical protein
MASIKYAVSVETDNEDAYVNIQKEIESFLDKNHLHETISDIYRNSDATSGKVLIKIFV